MDKNEVLQKMIDEFDFNPLEKIDCGGKRLDELGTLSGVLNNYRIDFLRALCRNSKLFDDKELRIIENELETSFETEQTKEKIMNAFDVCFTQYYNYMDEYEFSNKTLDDYPPEIRITEYIGNGLHTIGFNFVQNMTPEMMKHITNLQALSFASIAFGQIYMLGLFQKWIEEDMNCNILYHKGTKEDLLMRKELQLYIDKKRKIHLRHVNNAKKAWEEKTKDERETTIKIAKMLLNGNENKYYLSTLEKEIGYYCARNGIEHKMCSRAYTGYMENEPEIMNKVKKRKSNKKSVNHK
jgi:hypothetical protein